MADFAASSATHKPNLSNRERGEVIVQHEALLGFAFKALETLHVVAGAERGRNQRLGLTTSEDRAAVRARENTGFDPNFADLVERAAVRTVLVIDYLVAENALTQDLVILLDLRLACIVVFRHGGQQFLFEYPNQFVAFGFRMLRGIKSVGQPAANLRFQAFEVSFIKFRRRHLALRFADFGAQFTDGGTDLLDLGVGEFNGVHHRLFFHFFRARLDHDNRIGGAHDHDVEQAVAHFGVSGVDEEAAFHQTDAHGAKRAEKRDIGEGQGGGSGVDAADIGVVFRIRGQDKGDNLGLALEAFGEHGTDRPVNLAAGESLALAHAPFALDEAAGNASAGIGVLAVVNRERKEVDALAGLGIGGCGGENNVFAESDDGSAAGLLGKFSGFDGELFSACEFDGNFGGFRFHRSSFCRTEDGTEGHARQYGVRVDRRMPGGGWERTLLRLSRWNRPHT